MGFVKVLVYEMLYIFVVFEVGWLLEWWVMLIVWELVCLEVEDCCVFDVELCVDMFVLDGMGDVWIVVVVWVIVYWFDV